MKCCSCSKSKKTYGKKDLEVDKFIKKTKFNEKEVIDLRNRFD